MRSSTNCSSKTDWPVSMIVGKLCMEILANCRQNRKENEGPKLASFQPHFSHNLRGLSQK